MPKIRLSTRRVVVDRAHPTCVAVGVDTIGAVTVKPVDAEIVRSLKLRAKKVKFGDGYNLRFYSNSSSVWKVWFRQFDDGKVNFRTKAPSGTSAHDFLQILENNLGPWVLDAAFTRLDVHITVPLPFKEFFNGLDSGRRRAVMFYRMMPYGQSFYVGRVRGKAKYEVLVYDKQKESMLKNKGPPILHPCTRIEIATRPKEKMLVRELPLLQRHQPFKSVKRFVVNFKEPVKGRSKSQYQQKRDRFVELKTLYNVEGFFMTRRHLDLRTSFNFHRLYGDLYERELLSPSLDELFAAGMKKLFKR